MGVRVLLAASGGIDSSFTGYLLKEAGYEVVVVYLKLQESMGPGSSEAEERAKRISDLLGIPFISLDLVNIFREKVINPWLNEIVQGFTPNPCTICNEEIKFGFLLDYALDQGFDYLATGHYARLLADEDGHFHLLRGQDKAKDQSYMLYRLKTHTLPHILFPLGTWRKKDVTKKAQELGFTQTTLGESQDLCFIPRGSSLHYFFAQSGIKSQRGDIRKTSGEKIGEHEGLFNYTIGQRRGIRLPGGPYYVVRLDLERNTLIVGKKEEVYKRELRVSRVNWLSPIQPTLPLQATVQARYHHQASKATIYSAGDDKLKIEFSTPQFAITPGQAAVIYKEEEVLGGGVIEEAW